MAKEMSQDRYGLLTEAQVFGEEAIDVIRVLGTMCEATDYAILTGAQVSEDEAKAGGTSAGGPGGSYKGWPGRYFLSSAAGYGDVCTVNADGSRGVSYADAEGSLRPVIACSDPAELSAELCGEDLRCDAPDGMPVRIRRDVSGFDEVSYGEYPQDAADRTLARTLESDFAKGRLRRTGKTYRGEFQEYEYQGSKFIRARYEAAAPHRLSNGRVCRSGDPVWIRVQPVKWLWDPKAELLVSRRILVGGIRFSDENHYDGAFGNTGASCFLNASLCVDMLPSVLQEMTAGEKAAYEEDMRRAEKRRNPYGLTFGEVSEEDIIRGAIESDVAVFIHGPSSEGKSARVKQIDPTCEIIYLRNATPDSLNGRSVYNQATGEMIDIPPTWYKKVVAKCEAEPDTFHVVFFDEINNALPSIQGMAFNIVLDREVNGLWKLPPNARVVAAGNDMQDSLAANQIAAPFFNRFAHVYINTTTEKWLHWAKENYIHPAIYSYIAYRRGETLRSKYDGEKPNADPRKWEMASKMLYATGRPEMLRALIGEEITDEFVRFCNQPVITLEDVLRGNYTDQEIEEMNTAERYATTMGLSQAEESDLETVRAFVSRLGEEFRAIFDGLMAPAVKQQGKK